METSRSDLRSKPHFVLLDALRGVAAFIVIIYHIYEGFATSVQDQMCNHGYLAVDFFFLLSGFVIGYAYDDRWKTLSLRQFFTRRLIRLHPMVLAGVSMGAIAFVAGGCVGWDGLPVAWWRIVVATIAGMLFIPAIPGTFLDLRGFTEMFSLNGPAWSLFFEYIGNILYAILLRRLPTWALTLVVIATGGTLGWLVTGHGSLDYGWTLSSFWPGTMRLLFPYSFGLLLARLHNKYVKNATCSNSRQWATFALCSAVLSILLPMPYVGNGESPFPNGLYAIICVGVVFPLLVWLAALSGGIGRPNKAFRFLADMSFPIYLIHYPFMYLFYQHIEFPNVKIAPYEAWGAAFLTVLASTVTAYIVMRLYDEPVRRWLTKKLIKNSARNEHNK